MREKIKEKIKAVTSYKEVLIIIPAKFQVTNWHRKANIVLLF